MITVESFGKRTWKKHWAGEWSLLSCAYLGHQYTETIKEALGTCLDISMFISHKGYSVAYLDADDMKRFGEALAQKIVDNNDFAHGLADDLKKRTDEILDVIKKLESRPIDKEGYKDFLKAFYDYCAPHRGVKIVVDYLPADTLQKLLPILEEARVYSEPVYEATEKFMRVFAKQIAQEKGMAVELVLVTTKEEFDSYLDSGNLPDEDILKKRFEAGALLFEKGHYIAIDSQEVTHIEELLENAFKSATALKGTTAYPGKVTGKVRVILDPSANNKFDEGDILVTGMTRPEYLDLVKKSAAFITDAGGMLSHAAITARELKKPCVVGTQVATKILKDGMEVEVDAEKGIVTIV